VAKVKVSLEGLMKLTNIATQKMSKELLRDSYQDTDTSYEKVQEKM
jgi:hypothetical protein